MIETSRGISHQCPVPLPDTGGDRPKTAAFSQREGMTAPIDIVNTHGSKLLKRRPSVNTELRINTDPTARPVPQIKTEDAKASPMAPRHTSKRRDASFSDDAKN